MLFYSFIIANFRPKWKRIFYKNGDKKMPKIMAKRIRLPGLSADGFFHSCIFTPNMRVCLFPRGIFILRSGFQCESEEKFGRTLLPLDEQPGCTDTPGFFIEK